MTKRWRGGGGGDEEEGSLGALLARLRPRAGARPAWERAFASRVLARAHAELVRRAEAPSLWQLLARWPAPLVPAAVSVLAVVIGLAGSGGAPTTAGLLDGSDVGSTLRSDDPLSAVISDPVLALLAAGSTDQTAAGEPAPPGAPETTP